MFPGKGDKRSPGAKVFLILVFFLLARGLSLAEEGTRIIDEKLQMDLGDYFFKEGDYYRAITEYKRFQFFFPQSLRVEEAMWKIAQSYYNGKKWDETISASDALRQKFPSSSWMAESLILNGLSLKEKKDFSRARDSFRKVREVALREALAAEAQWQIALTYLQEEKWKEAAVEFRKIDRNSKIYRKGEHWANSLDRIDEIPQKSPATAGVLAALLPGAGHLYCGRYRDATVAFLLNGAFIWGMVEAFEHKNYVVGGILTFFELGWYSGNIYSAVASAHKFNRKKKQEYLEYIEKGSHLSLGISLQGKSPVLSLDYVF